MNLRCWVTNDPTLRNAFAPEDRDTSHQISVLGTMWNPFSDTLNIKGFKIAVTFTLRGMLSSMASFYDICGIFSPIPIRAKMLIQEVQLIEPSWDAPISEEYCQIWEDLEQDLIAATQSEFSRFLVSINDEYFYQLHIFADASAKAFAAVAYIRATSKSTNTINTYLLFSKSRIVRPDILTIPKLELTAVVLATRMLQFLRTALPIEFQQQIIWSDSKCVLAWIANHDKIRPPFIQHHLTEIRDYTDVSFRYVPSKDNPADLPSHGVSLSELSESIWWNGPAWLATDDWPPIEKLEEPFLADLQPERVVLCAAVPMYQPPFCINAERFSELMHLLKLTATAISFLSKFLNPKIRDIFAAGKRPIAQAELIWIQAEQRYHYADILAALRNKKKHNLTSRLGLFLDNNNVIRCAHHLRNANLPFVAKFPILLPKVKASYFSQLMVLYFHGLTYHQGTAYMLNSLRREFWLPQGRKAVSSSVRACQKCKKFMSRAFPQPDNFQLPSFRLSEECHPFQNIGVDTCGKLLVEGRTYYILVIVDLVCRAIDLEILIYLTQKNYF